MQINGLSLKLTAPVMLISALAIALTAFLNFGKFSHSFDELEESRIGFVLADLQATIETGLDLGLRLQDLANAQAALNLQAAADPEIISLSLFDTDGSRVFHSGAALPAGAGMQPLASAMHEATQASWFLLREDGRYAGSRVSTAIVANGGSLLVRYSRQRRDQVLQEVRDELMLAALFCLLLVALLASFCVRRVVHAANHKLQLYAQSVTPP